MAPNNGSLTSTSGTASDVADSFLTSYMPNRTAYVQQVREEMDRYLSQVGTQQYSTGPPPGW